MRPREARERLARMEFPVTHEKLVARVGDECIEAPTGDAVELRTVLERTDRTSYRSVEDAYTAVLGNLGDDYVGRKYYDDRGSNPHDRQEQSF